MSQSTHQLAIKGKDQTGAAFASVESRAAAAGAKIRSALGGALSAVGAYLSLRAVGDGINQLGHLSDVAKKTSTNVDELTRATAAMGVLGINANVEGLAKAFQLMEKNTGRSGLQGFYDTIGELGKVPDVSDRAAAAMKVFGRSGLEFLPLINAAHTSTLALEDVVNAMPNIPQAAADAGDDAADAMLIAANTVKSIWLQGLSVICRWFGEDYEGGVRVAALNAGNALTYYTKIAVTRCIEYFRKLQAYITPTFDAIGSFIGAVWGGGSLGEAWEMAGQAFDQSMDEMEDRIEEIGRVAEERVARVTKAFEDQKIAIEKVAQAYGKAAISTSARKLETGEGSDIAEVQKAPAIRNELIMGDSNTALRTAMLGPQLQAESKKQTALLQKIADNTAKTADNTDDIADGETYQEI